MYRWIAWESCQKAISESVDVELVLRLCIPNKSPGHAEAAYSSATPGGKVTAVTISSLNANCSWVSTVGVKTPKAMWYPSIFICSHPNLPPAIFPHASPASENRELLQTHWTPYFFLPLSQSPNKQSWKVGRGLRETWLFNRDLKGNMISNVETSGFWDLSASIVSEIALCY